MSLFTVLKFCTAVMMAVTGNNVLIMLITSGHESNLTPGREVLLSIIIYIYFFSTETRFILTFVSLADVVANTMPFVSIAVLLFWREFCIFFRGICL